MISPSLDQIFNTALSCFDVSLEEYNSEKDTRSLTAITIRQVVCYLGQRFGYSQSVIGKYLGIDHSTVCYNKKVAKDLCDTEVEYASNMIMAIDKLDGFVKKLIQYDINGWVARDEDNALNFYVRQKPIRVNGFWMSDAYYYSLPQEAYPSITYESEPHACTMTLKLK